MAGEWKTVRLGDLTSWSSGGTPSKANPEFWNGDIPWISASSMKTPLLCNSELKITKSGLENGSRLAETNSILLLVRGSELHNRIPVGVATRPVAFNQDVKALKVRGEMRSDYLFYWLLGNETMLLGKVEQTGIGAGKLDTEVLKNLPIALPPLAEQKSIAAVLGALDDKIELNQRMNSTLEAMARALFQSWFVDFDPVRAKLDGRNPIGLDETTAALFPEHLEETSVGHIPKEWTEGKLGDIGTNSRRGVQPGDIAPNTPYIALEHMPRRCIALGDWDDSADVASGKSAFKKGEILFGKLRPYFHKVGVAPFDGVCSTDILVLAPKGPEWFGFLLGHASSDELIQFTDLASTGTKMPRTNWSDISSFKVALPPKPIAAAFTRNIQPILDRIHANLHQSRTLATLRDTLLPKLLSGELSLKTVSQKTEGLTTR